MQSQGFSSSRVHKVTFQWAVFDHAVIQVHVFKQCSKSGFFFLQINCFVITLVSIFYLQLRIEFKVCERFPKLKCIFFSNGRQKTA